MSRCDVKRKAVQNLTILRTIVKTKILTNFITHIQYFSK